MKFLMIGQEKGDLLIQVTSWADLAVYVQAVGQAKYLSI